MEPSFKLLLSLVLMCSFASSSSTVIGREIKPNPTLWERLKIEEDGTSTCWDSLFELQSCTGEIVLFFLNGETYLGRSCCDAIQTIQHHCWPSMLSSVGINSEESDILLGYCDASDGGNDSGSTPLPRPQAPNPIINTTTSSSHEINP